MSEVCYLLADIGGTNARFAIANESGAALRCVISFHCADFARLEDAVDAYLRRVEEELVVRPGVFCLAVAAAVYGDIITFTNHPWTFSRRELERTLKIPVRVLNDFEAQALSLTRVCNDDLEWLQLPSAFPGVTAARTVVGPGTGFGSATLTPGGEVLKSEPGHVSFAPVSVHEIGVLQQLSQRYPRVSVEHLLSGPGLENLYWANARVMHISERQTDVPVSAPDIVEFAFHGDELANQTVKNFCAILGSVCGDIALSMGSRGGFYLSGGILQKLGNLFNHELFMSRFVAKGPFEDWCAQVPVARITLDWPGLIGCAVHAGMVTDAIDSSDGGGD